jgi:hypothetical protein
VKRAIAILAMLAGAAFGQWDASPVLSVLGRSQADTLTVYAKTTGAVESVVLAAIKSSVACTISWGDGAVSNLAAATTYSSLTHVYATAGTYPVVVASASKLTVLNLSNSKWAGLKSSELRSSTGLDDFRCYYSGSHASGRFASSDVSAWRPTVFYLYGMPAGYAGTFNSSDVSAWRPSVFSINNMPAGYAGTFNSSDVSAWRPSNLYLYSMPAGYAGTFNSSDVSAWRPTYFYLYSMPAGYAGTFNSSDVSAWRPTYFYLHTMATNFTFTHSAGGFTNFLATTIFQMQSMAMSTSTVDAVLWDLYQATKAPRTGSAGNINVGGSNADPSGTYQAASSCPVTGSTPGKEIAHELKNDGCGAGFNKWTTVDY